MVTRKQILKQINCKHLDLFKGDGYWYFVYDGFGPGEVLPKYDTRSVYTMYLNDMTLAQWVEEGRALVKDCE